MKFSMKKYHDFDNACEVVSFKGEIQVVDLVRLVLDPLDSALLNEVNKDKEAKASDWLFVLEMLFRRYEEQNERQSSTKSLLTPAENMG